MWPATPGAALGRVKRLNLAHDWLTDPAPPRRTTSRGAGRASSSADAAAGPRRPGRAVRWPAAAPVGGAPSPVDRRPPGQQRSRSARMEGRPADAGRRNPYAEYAWPGTALGTWRVRTRRGSTRALGTGARSQHARAGGPRQRAHGRRDLVIPRLDAGAARHGRTNVLGASSSPALVAGDRCVCGGRRGGVASRARPAGPRSRVSRAGRLPWGQCQGRIHL